jgi:hypothetical protein
VITYARGDRIPEALRDRRFLYKGKPSANALKKYWRVLEDGRPDPNCSPFLRVCEIEILHTLSPSLGQYRIDSGKPGRPSTGWSRKEYDRQRNADKKQSLGVKRSRKPNAQALPQQSELERLRLENADLRLELQRALRSAEGNAATEIISKAAKLLESEKQQSNNEG